MFSSTRLLTTTKLPSITPSIFSTSIKQQFFAPYTTKPILTPIQYSFRPITTHQSHIYSTRTRYSKSPYTYTQRRNTTNPQSDSKPTSTSTTTTSSTIKSESTSQPHQTIPEQPQIIEKVLTPEQIEFQRQYEITRNKMLEHNHAEGEWSHASLLERQAVEINVKAREMKAKEDKKAAKKANAASSPFSSFLFPFVLIVIPSATLFWYAHVNPVGLRLKYSKFRRFLRSFKPIYLDQYQFFDSHLQVDKTMAFECNLKDTANLQYNIFQAQKIILKEIGKSYHYLSLINQFREHLPEIMQIPGFVNNQQLEFQARSMRENAAEIDHLLSSISFGMMKSLVQEEYEMTLDPTRVATDYRKLLDDLIKKDIQAEKKWRQQYTTLQKAHEHLDAERAQGRGVLIFRKKDENGNVIETTFDGSEGIDEFVPVIPDDPDLTHEDIQQIIREQRYSHKLKGHIVESYRRDQIERQEIEKFKSNELQRQSLIPLGVERKSNGNAYSNSEVEYAYFRKLQEYNTLILSRNQCLEILLAELNTQLQRILTLKQQYQEQEAEKTEYITKQLAVMKKDNIWSDNTLPTTPNTLNTSNNISPYSFVFDLEPLEEITQQKTVHFIHQFIASGLKNFWSQQTQFKYNVESILATLQQYPTYETELYESTGLTPKQVKKLPTGTNIGRVVSLPANALVGSGDWYECHPFNLLHTIKVVKTHETNPTEAYNDNATNILGV